MCHVWDVGLNNFQNRLLSQLVMIWLYLRCKPARCAASARPPGRLESRPESAGVEVLELAPGCPAPQRTRYLNSNKLIFICKKTVQRYMTQWYTIGNSSILKATMYRFFIESSPIWYFISLRTNGTKNRPTTSFCTTQ